MPDKGEEEKLGPGETFYEPPGALHAVSRNGSPTQPPRADQARFILMKRRFRPGIQSLASRLDFFGTKTPDSKRKESIRHLYAARPTVAVSRKGSWSMDVSVSPLFFLWLTAVVAFICAYRAGRRRNQSIPRDY